jgi:predicted site-specific integrase-resolvase
VHQHDDLLKILSFEEAARIVGRNAKTLRRWAERGTLPTVCLGGRPALVYADVLRALGQLHHYSDANEGQDEEKR